MVSRAVEVMATAIVAAAGVGVGVAEAVPGDLENPVSVVVAVVADVIVEGFGDPQPTEDQQRDQRE